MTRIILSVICGLVVGAAGPAGAADFRMLHGQAFKGMHYRVLKLQRPDTGHCARLCRQDPRCRAFTYLAPGFRGSRRAVCVLKNGVGRLMPCRLCITGIKVGAHRPGHHRGAPRWRPGQPPSGPGPSGPPGRNCRWVEKCNPLACKVVCGQPKMACRFKCIPSPTYWPPRTVKVRRPKQVCKYGMTECRCKLWGAEGENPHCIGQGVVKRLCKQCNNECSFQFVRLCTCQTQKSNCAVKRHCRRVCPPRSCRKVMVCN
jgi:hypothetical protein